MEDFDINDIKLEKSDEKGMIDLQSIKEYITKAEKAICKIILSNGYGSGFFCRIPYTENNNLLLPVLITNNHVLSRNIIESENNIELLIEDEIKNIPLNKPRKKWTNEKMDFTVIEILESDNIDDFYYLDDNILKKKYSNNIYLNKKVLIFAINTNQKIGFSNGKIKKVLGDYSFAYTCNTYKGCSGGCIINENNNCVIGIHRGELKKVNDKAINASIFIWNVINFIKGSKASGESHEIFVLFKGKAPARVKIQLDEPVNTLYKLLDISPNSVRFMNGVILLNNHKTFREQDVRRTIRTTDNYMPG